MNGTDFFQVRYGTAVLIGELAPSGTAQAWPIGTAMQKTDDEVCVPADGNFDGFLAKEVTAAGPTFEKMTLGYPNNPAKYGDKATLKALPDGSLIEVEGEPTIIVTATPTTYGTHLLVTSGTGAISGTTAQDTRLSFKNGRWYEAQVGDFVFGVLRRQLTPKTALNIRIEIELRRGELKLT